jgi:hypothetical protein
MAADKALKTYDVSTNVRDVTDLIAVVANTDTPLYSGLGKTKATGKYHESQSYALTTGASNAQVEGADYTLALSSVPSTVGNYTQIFYKQATVSKDQQASATYGIDDMLAAQLEWRMKEIATDVEKALIAGTGNSGASGTARLLTGALALITTNVETGTGTGNEALTEDMFNDALQTIWTAGGRPKNVYVNAGQKRVISSFTASNTKNVMADAKKLVNAVDVYVSDFGMMEVSLDSFMDTDKVLIIDKSMWKVAMFRPFIVEDYPSQGSYVAKTIEGSLTLDCSNQLSSGKIIQLS